MKQLITFCFVISYLAQIAFAQDSAQIIKGSAQVVQKNSLPTGHPDSILTANDSAQVAQDSLQTTGNTIKIEQDSAQVAQDAIQKDQDSAQTSQDTNQVKLNLIQIGKFNPPYTTSFKKDAPIISTGVGLTALGVYLIQNKKALTNSELLSKTKNEVPVFDRGNAGFYSKKANDDSYIPFTAGFAMPLVLMLVNKNERQKFGQIFVLYTETMAITGALFTITAGALNRSRPLVYGSEAPLSLRLAGKSQRSFYAGHTAAVAAASFFAARVFQDFNPDSKARAFVWTIAAILPAVTGYLRYEAGEHFLSDNILGYAIGAATGILIPKWHKNKAKNFNIMPETSHNYKGVSVKYSFQN